MKHGVDQKILGEDPSEAEIKIRIKQGFDPDDARAATITRWMRNGHLRPFQVYLDKALCTDGKMIALDRMIVDCLAECITLGLLVAKPGRGRRSPANFVWDYTAKRLCDRERAAGLSHKKAVKEVALRLQRPESTHSVRKAVTVMRPRKPRQVRKPSEK